MYTKVVNTNNNHGEIPKSNEHKLDRNFKLVELRLIDFTFQPSLGTRCFSSKKFTIFLISTFGEYFQIGFKLLTGCYIKLPLTGG
jgi:hypothetical protein